MSFLLYYHLVQLILYPGEYLFWVSLQHSLYQDYIASNGRVSDESEMGEEFRNKYIIIAKPTDYPEIFLKLTTVRIITILAETGRV